MGLVNKNIVKTPTDLGPRCLKKTDRDRVSSEDGIKLYITGIKVARVQRGAWDASMHWLVSYGGEGIEYGNNLATDADYNSRSRGLFSGIPRKKFLIHSSSGNKK